MDARPARRRPFARGGLGRDPELGGRTRLARRRPNQRPDLRGARHLGQIREVERVQARQERRVVAEALVTDHPAGAQRPASHRSLHQVPRDRVFGLERRVRGNEAGLPAVRVRLGEPGRRQIETPIEQRRAFTAGIAQEDARLAIILLARGPAPLARHPRRVRPLLGHIAPVDDQHTIGLAQRLLDEPLVLRQDGVVVPGPLPDKMLQRPHAAIRPVRSPQQP